MPLYNFSFGSNMSSNRLLARLPNAKRVGTAILKGYELTFDMFFSDGSGKCSIQKTDKADALVYGVVYEVNADEKLILDEIEGPGYDCVDITVELLNGQTIDTHCYIANTHDEDVLPFDWYVKHVHRGALEAGVPKAYSDAILNRPQKSDPNKERAAIEFAVHQ
ncbi:gamma-glutamylcyclotransferase family protein [Pseudoalteromonas marina]|uniref:Gamma-glutamylcyclotransferase family protein n=1 Tax=Pseudoalteromonas marina TaxID=267375 RepID=A0ABT9FH34_9GAMM|nr:gamma-glutamylcyclotransferase family protein [Pseudoalteromonas marina]MDP2566085.1 gamma-glutamylcyclotransferase family protein [Pseudoalteromonas marina]